MLIGPHRVPAADFDMLAHGYADSSVVEMLRAARHSKQTLLIRAVIDAARPFRRAYAAAAVDDAVRVIDEAQRRSAAATASVLGYPLVGAWAARCLRRLRHPSEPDTPLWVELAQLAAIAAAAAIRAGSPVTLPIPLRAGTMSLPTLGSARLASDARWGVATLRGEAGDYTIEGSHGTLTVPLDPAQQTADWMPVHRLVFTDRHQTLTVLLDSTDPYRGRRAATAGGLDAPVLAAWRAGLQRAWTILVRHHPERAAELAAGPITIVPLAAAGAVPVSGTNRASVGAMELALPPDPFEAALSIVHEFQHSKLGGLLDLVDLCVAGDRRRFYSPWRPDPRPAIGLLQGAYAFLAVAGCWGRHAGHDTGVVASRLAEYEFARIHGQVEAAVRELAGSGVLTRPGERFVAGLRDAVDALASRPISADAARLARLSRDDHWTTWRLHNLHIDPATVASLAQAWCRSERRPTGHPPPRLVATPSSPASRQQRHDRARRRIDPASAGAGPDAALAAGDYPAAANGYLAGLRADPHRLDLWAGLAVARQRTGPPPLARTYATEPELLVALHGRLAAAGMAAPPDALAAWLAGRPAG